jgi:murein DD-endopeptidase MepM/ murein hydrolase activator NlpD/DNA polymerase III epsilon subunit-like protein
MVALPAQDDSQPSLDQKPATNSFDGLTFPGVYKHFAVPSSIDPKNFTTVLKYIQAFLEPLKTGLSSGKRTNISYRQGFAEPTELKQLELNLNNRSGKASQQAGMEDDSEVTKQTGASQANTLYLSDLVTILSEIHEYLSSAYDGKGFPLKGFTGPSLLDESFTELWTLNQTTKKPIGFEETKLYSLSQSAITQQINSLYTLVSEKLNDSQDAEKSFGSITEAVRDLTISTLHTHAKEVILPLLRDLQETKLYSKTATIKVTRKGPQLFKIGGDGAETIKAYLNEFFRVFVNQLADESKTSNDKLVKLRQKLQNPEFVAKYRSIVDRLISPSSLGDTLGFAKFTKLEAKADSKERTVLALRKVSDTHNIFSLSEELTQSDLDVVKTLAEIIEAISILIEIEFKPSAASSAAQEDEKDGIEGSDTPEVPEKEVTQLVPLNTLLKNTQEKLVSLTFKNWNTDAVKTIVSNWKSAAVQNGFDISQTDFWLKQELENKVVTAFEADYFVHQLNLTKDLKQLPESFSVFVSDTDPFYDPETQNFIFNPSSEESAYSRWFAYLATSIAQPIANGFSEENAIMDSLDSYTSTQILPVHLPESEQSRSLNDDSLETIVSDQQLLKVLIGEYQKFSGNSEVKNQEELFEALKSLRDTNGKSYIDFLDRMGYLKFLHSRVTTIALMQLSRQGIDIDKLDPSEKARLLASVTADFDIFLLSYPADKLILALNDPTAILQIISEFNRKFLLQQTSSAKTIREFVAYTLINKHQEAESEITQLLEEYARNNSLRAQEALKEKLHALIVVSGYNPKSTELEQLSQKQLELVFGFQFSRQLTDDELAHFKAVIHKYVSQHYYEQVFDKESTIVEEIAKFNETTNAFYKEKRHALEKIHTTITSTIGGIVPISISVDELDATIANLVASGLSSDQISPSQIANLIGISEEDLSKSPEIEEKLKNIVDLLKDYLERYEKKANATRVALKHLSRKKMVGAGVIPISSALSSNKGTKAYGELLEKFGSELDGSPFSKMAGFRSDGDVSQKDDFIPSLLEKRAERRFTSREKTLLEWRLKETLLAFNQVKKSQKESGSNEIPLWVMGMQLNDASQFSRLDLKDFEFELMAFEQYVTQLQAQAEADEFARQVYEYEVAVQNEEIRQAAAVSNFAIQPGYFPSIAALARNQIAPQQTLGKSTKRNTNSFFDRLRKLKSGGKKKKNFAQKAFDKVTKRVRNKIAAMLAGFTLQAIMTLIGLAVKAAILIGSIILAGIAFIGAPFIVAAVALALAAVAFPTIGSAIAGFFKGVASTISGVVNSIIGAFSGGGGGGTITAIGATALSVTTCSYFLLDLIDKSTLIFPTEPVGVEEESPYIDLQKIASITQVENNELVDISYTIIMSAKDNYTLTPLVVDGVVQANDEFRVTVGTTNIEPEAPVPQMRATLLNEIIGATPLVFEYTISGISGEDALLTNTFEIEFTYDNGEESGTSSFRAREVVRFGEPDILLCWPTSGRISQLPFQPLGQGIADPSHNRPRGRDSAGNEIRVGADAYDIVAPVGAPIFSPFDGVVLPQLPNTGVGSFGDGFGPFHIIIRSSVSTEIYVFAHNSSMVVNPGERVTRGQVIGYVGGLGYSSGPHLHFEKSYRGRLLNISDRSQMTLESEMPPDIQGRVPILGSIVESDCN